MRIYMRLLWSDYVLISTITEDLPSNLVPIVVSISDLSMIDHTTYIMLPQAIPKCSYR